MPVWLVTTHIVDHDDDHVIAASLEAAKRLVLEAFSQRPRFWAGDTPARFVMEVNIAEDDTPGGIIIEQLGNSENYFWIREAHVWE